MMITELLFRQETRGKIIDSEDPEKPSAGANLVCQAPIQDDTNAADILT
jgi:hypothetical protein